MKNIFIIFSCMVIIISGCMSTKNTNSYKNIELLDASYTEWNELSPVKSDVRERGYDLKLKFREWPEDIEPQYIVFRNWKSFTAGISGNTSGDVIITATIITRSAMLENRSIESDVTDRLVFTNSQGVLDFIEIVNWKRKSRAE